MEMEEEGVVSGYEMTVPATILHGSCCVTVKMMLMMMTTDNDHLKRNVPPVRTHYLAPFLCGKVLRRHVTVRRSNFDLTRECPVLQRLFSAIADPQIVRPRARNMLLCRCGGEGQGIRWEDDCRCGGEGQSIRWEDGGGGTMRRYTVVGLRMRYILI